jgi:uncharacterized protein (TIGR02246 family)
MPKSAALLTTPDDVEHQFYDALNSADIELMMSCWADDDEVTCVPPGGELVRGPAAIRDMFAALFARGPVVVAVSEIHRLPGLSHAVHTLIEGVRVTTDAGQATADVNATNVYCKTAQGWRLQAHHASPGRLRPTDSVQTISSPTLH